METANYPPSVKVVGDGREVGADEDVQKCLEMVAMSRVFDVDGLWEVLSEVGRDARVAGSLDGIDRAVGDGGVGKGNEGVQSAPQPEIVDSEEEDIIISEPRHPSVQQQSPAADPPRPTKTSPDDEDEGTEIIVIDNMTHLINELFSRKERTEGKTPHNTYAPGN